MKRVTVQAWKKGLVFKRNEFAYMLNEGKHWIGWNESLVVADMARPFAPIGNLNLFLRNEAFADATLLVEVKNNEIALQYEEGLFTKVLSAGRYVFWKGLVNYRFEIVNLENMQIAENIDRSILSNKEVVPYVRVCNVESNEKGILYVDGKFERLLDSGAYYFWKNITTVTVARVDMRAMQLEISGQEILTRDKAALRINFYAQYQVIDPVKAIVNNKEYDKQLYVLMQLVLREFVGALTLDELLEKREKVSDFILNSVSERITALGVQLNACGIRDVILPGDMKEIMNQVLVAEKKAQANTIMRREETASTRSLLNTAKLMEDNAMLYKLKEMEYVEKIAEKINSISLSGGTQIADQLKQIFISGK